MNVLTLMSDQPPHPADRDLRLERAVALVTDSKYSVRKAAHALSLPKSTVHRYLQATRSSSAAAAAQAAASANGVAKRRRTAGGSPSAPLRPMPDARPSKCDIAFLLHDAPPTSSGGRHRPSARPGPSSSRMDVGRRSGSESGYSGIKRSGRPDARHHHPHSRPHHQGPSHASRSAGQMPIPGSRLPPLKTGGRIEDRRDLRRIWT